MKSGGPDAPTLASSHAEMCRAQPGLRYIFNPQGDGGKKARSPGRSRISRNPSRRESRMIRFTCGLLVRFVCTTAGAIGARLSLRPSFPGRVKLMQASGAWRRENADVYLLAV